MHKPSTCKNFVFKKPFQTNVSNGNIFDFPWKHFKKISAADHIDATCIFVAQHVFWAPSLRVLCRRQGRFLMISIEK